MNTVLITTRLRFYHKRITNKMSRHLISPSAMDHFMNILAYFQNYLRSFPNHHHGGTIDRIDDMHVELQEQTGGEREGTPEPTIRPRRCGFCREPGHNVIHCNNPEVMLHRTEILRMITDGDLTNLEEWVTTKETKLLKAVVCPFTAVRYNSQYTRSSLEDMIVSFVRNRRRILEENVTRNQFRSIQRDLEIDSYRQHMHRNIVDYRGRRNMHSAVHTALMNTAQRQENLPITRIYQRLSIEFKVVNEVGENSEYESEHYDFECPICYEGCYPPNYSITTNCNHKFCKECIDTTLKFTINSPYFTGYADCPLCRTTLETISVSGYVEPI